MPIQYALMILLIFLFHTYLENLSMTLWGHGYVNVIDAGSEYVGPCYYVNMSEFVEPRCYLMLLIPVATLWEPWYYVKVSEGVGPLYYFNVIDAGSESFRAPEISCRN